MQNLINRFVREEEGQDLVEYALLLGLIAAVLIAAIAALGVTITSRFTTVNAAVAS